MVETEVKVASIPAVAVIVEEQLEEEKALSTQVTEIEQRAEDFIIETDEDYQNAAEFGRMLKQQSARVKEFFKPMKDNAHKAHKAICDRESAMLKPLTNAESILKKTMADFHMEQERRRREAEEAARRAAEAEADRKLKEAAEAEAAGNTFEAEMAMNEALMMDAAKDAVVVPAYVPKAAGTSAKKDWIIKNVDVSKIPHDMLVAIVSGIKQDYVNAAILSMIRGSKGTLSIPGVEYEETVSMSFRR